MSNEGLREETLRLVAKLTTIKRELGEVGSTINSLLCADVPNFWAREMKQAAERLRGAISSVESARIKAERAGETVEERG